MKNKKKILFSLLLTFLFGFFWTELVQAQDQEHKTINMEQVIGFRAEAILPSNQVDPAVSYYYLKEKPGQSDEIQLKLTNVGKEDKIVDMSINDASTNRNGLIVYDKDKKQLKGSDEESSNNIAKTNNPITTIAHLEEKQICLSPGETRYIKIKINPSMNFFKGIKLGGIVVKEKTKAASKGVRNIYSYTIGLAITEEERSHLYGHQSLRLKEVAAEVENGYKYIEADIYNVAPEIFNQADIKGVIKNNKGKVFLKSHLKEVSIAPESVLPFSFDIGKNDLKAGNYIFEGEATAEGKTWHFKKEFSIGRNQAKTLNEMAVNKYNIPWLVNEGKVLLWGMMAILLVYKIYQNKKRG